MIRSRCFRDIAVTLVCILLCAGAIAAASHSSARSRWGTFVELFSGPVGGWVGAVQLSEFPDALSTLIPATLIAIAPFALYALYGSRLALMWAVVVWIACGCFYTFAVGA